MDKKVELAILLQVEGRNAMFTGERYLVITGRIGQVVNQTWTGLGSYDALSGLELRAQTDEDRAREGRLGMYGFNLKYVGEDVDLYRAKAMVKVLSAYERKMAKLYDKYGRAETFATFATRAADALGIDAFFVQHKDGTGLRRINASEAAYWIKSTEADFAERFKPAEVNV